MSVSILRLVDSSCDTTTRHTRKNVEIVARIALEFQNISKIFSLEWKQTQPSREVTDRLCENKRNTQARIKEIRVLGEVPTSKKKNCIFPSFRSFLSFLLRRRCGKMKERTFDSFFAQQLKYMKTLNLLWSGDAIVWKCRTRKQQVSESIRKARMRKIERCE